MSVFFDITKVTDFWLENADISRNEEMKKFFSQVLLIV